MVIENADNYGKDTWNEFVREHYPPVGGFMQSWEWGQFQGALGRKMSRWLVTDGGKLVAAFTLTLHSLPLGMKYGYAARGPVLAKSHSERLTDVCKSIRGWAQKEFQNLVFLRLEPPADKAPDGLLAPDSEFEAPDYYIQPRLNLTVPLDQSEENILKSFHSSTRSNVRRAEKRGVTVDILTDIPAEEYAHFKSMMRDTIQRNSGKNAYPNDDYFAALFKILADNAAGVENTDKNLSVIGFYGRRDGEAAATHFVLFFGDTATYIYGAAHTKHLNSKVTTYLHWAAIQEAKRRGMKYYDIGGIDAKRWPSLTDFKRQFRGKEFSYLGNIDIPLRSLAYRAYNLARRLKK